MILSFPEVKTEDEADALLGQHCAIEPPFSEGDKQVLKDYAQAYAFLAKVRPDLKVAYQAGARGYEKMSKL